MLQRSNGESARLAQLRNDEFDVTFFQNFTCNSVSFYPANSSSFGSPFASPNLAPTNMVVKVNNPFWERWR